MRSRTSAVHPDHATPVDRSGPSARAQMWGWPYPSGSARGLVSTRRSASTRGAGPGPGRGRERLAARGGRGGHRRAGRRAERQRSLLPHRGPVRAGPRPPLPRGSGRGRDGARQRRRGRRPTGSTTRSRPRLLPFDGGPAEEALRTQTVQVVARPDRRPPSGGQRPELGGARAGDRARGGARAAGADPAGRARRGRAGADRPDRRTCWRSWSSRTGGTPTCSSGASAARSVHPARRDPAPAAARRVHLRGRGLHPVGVAGAGGDRSAATPSTTAWPATSCTCR